MWKKTARNAWSDACFEEVRRYCETMLSGSQPVGSALPQVMTLVGRFFNLERIFLYRQSGEGRFACVLVWQAGRGGYAPPVSPVIDFNRGGSSLRAGFDEDGMVIASDIACLPPDIYDLAYPLDTVALLVMPITREGRLWGFAGFDDRRYREWNADEIVLLGEMCTLLAHRPSDPPPNEDERHYE